MAKKRQRTYELPSITNPTSDQLKRFFIVAKNLNDDTLRGTVTDEDFKFFLSVNFGGFDEAKFKQLQEVVNRERKAGDEVISSETMKAFVDQARLMIASPENKDRLARLMQQENAKAKSTAFSNAVNLFLSGADFLSAQRQVQEFKRQSKMLQKPGTLPVLGVDPYLEAAKRSAETAPARETVAALAAGQQLGDIYRGELAMAPVAAAGQAGAVGALSQAAATRRRRGALEMMPALEQIRAQQQGERAQLAGLSAQQAQAINRSAQTAQYEAQQQYDLEQRALAQLGATGRYNRLEALGSLGAALTPLVAGGRQQLPVTVGQTPTVNTPMGITPGAIQEQTSRSLPLPSRVDQYGRPVEIPSVAPGALQAGGLTLPSRVSQYGTPMEKRIPISNETANTFMAMGGSPEQAARFFGVNPSMRNTGAYNAALETGMASRLPQEDIDMLNRLPETLRRIRLK